jgi:hypothetical protein
MQILHGVLNVMQWTMFHGLQHFASSPFQRGEFNINHETTILQNLTIAGFLLCNILCRTSHTTRMVIE